MKIKNISAMHDFVSYIILGAVNSFGYQDYLPPEEKMTLHRAFESLTDAISLIDPDMADDREELRALLRDSLAAYERGDMGAGIDLLEDFRSRIFKVD